MKFAHKFYLYLIQVISCVTDGLNNTLLVQHSGHDLNNTDVSILQMFVIKIPTVVPDLPAQPLHPHRLQPVHPLHRAQASGLLQT